MSVAFTARSIYDYLFSKDEEGILPDIDKIRKIDVARFCQLLEKEISSHADISPHYKYVYFDNDSFSMFRFFVDEQHTYLDFDEYVLFCGTCSVEMSRAIEEKYDDDVVTQSLRYARAQVRQGISSD